MGRGCLKQSSQRQPFINWRSAKRRSEQRSFRPVFGFRWAGADPVPSDRGWSVEHRSSDAARVGADGCTGRTDRRCTAGFGCSFPSDDGQLGAHAGRTGSPIVGWRWWHSDVGQSGDAAADAVGSATDTVARRTGRTCLCCAASSGTSSFERRFRRRRSRTCARVCGPCRTRRNRRLHASAVGW